MGFEVCECGRLWVSCGNGGCGLVLVVAVGVVPVVAVGDDDDDSAGGFVLI